MSPSYYYFHNNNRICHIYLVHLPTTCKYPCWLFIGSVLIWHMYHPLSASFTSRMCRNHTRWSLCVTAIRWFFVITWLWMVNMVWVSTRNHATCKAKVKSRTDILFNNNSYIIRVCMRLTCGRISFRVGACLKYLSFLNVIKTRSL